MLGRGRISRVGARTSALAVIVGASMFFAGTPSAWAASPETTIDLGTPTTVDVSGETPDPTPAIQPWNGDVTGPDTAIDSGPSGFVASSDATFDISGSDPMSAVASWGGPESGDGEFVHPYSVATDAGGDVYVADQGNNRIQKIDSDGNLLTQWGTLGSDTGRLDAPSGVAVNAAGEVLVSDTGNNRIVVFDSDGNYLRQFGEAGSGDGQFHSPRGLAIDVSGNIFVSDVYNQRIQKFDPFGNFVTEWGTYGDGDGQFKYPFGIAVGTDGNVFVADYSNARIQMFGPSGKFVAGWGTYGEGDGQFRYPYGVSVDPGGNVYVADTYNDRIQVFDPNGEFLAKWGTPGTSGGQLRLPYGIAFGGSGSAYVADLGNDRIQEFSTAPSSFECSLDGEAWSECGSPVAFTALTEGSHTLNVRSIDADGSADATPASRTWTVDTTGPVATIDGNPADSTTTTDATFDLTADDGTGSGVASFECALDGAAFAACTSPAAYAGLPNGAHTFSARAIDLLGNIGPPASIEWSIGADADTSIVSGPTGEVGSADATFDFSGDDGTGAPATAFECSLDGAAFAACSSPSAFTDLLDGPHTFDVRALNALSVPDPTPASATWTVDAAPPSTKITAHPADPASVTNATFEFTSGDGDGSGVSAQECSLDGGPWSVCASPATLTDLADGSHTFDVRATDVAGNTGHAASFSWTVAIAAPDASLDESPSGAPVDPSPVEPTVAA